METVIVAIEKENNDERAYNERWSRLYNTVKGKADKNENVKWLNESLLQIPLDSGLLILSEILLLCKREGFPCKTLFFDEEPKWITS